jgi:Ulp1 family protease
MFPSFALGSRSSSSSLPKFFSFPSHLAFGSSMQLSPKVSSINFPCAPARKSRTVAASYLRKGLFFLNEHPFPPSYFSAFTICYFKLLRRTSNSVLYSSQSSPLAIPGLCHWSQVCCGSLSLLFERALFFLFPLSAVHDVCLISNATSGEILQHHSPCKSGKKWLLS